MIYYNKTAPTMAQVDNELSKLTLDDINSINLFGEDVIFDKPTPDNPMWCNSCRLTLDKNREFYQRAYDRYFSEIDWVTLDNMCIDVSERGENAQDKGYVILSISAEQFVTSEDIKRAFVESHDLTGEKGDAIRSKIRSASFHIENGVLIEYAGSEEHFVVPDGVDQLGKYVFFDCADIKSVKLPEGLKFINESAFADCTNLESVTLPNTLEYIGNGAFLNCKNLKEITIPDSVERIGVYAFSGCDNLKNVSIPQGCYVDINAFQRHHNVTRRNSEPQRQRGMKI